MTLFLIFLTLQLFDAVTTLVFLGRGVAEGNPLIAAFFHTSGHPAITLVLVKTAACALALVAWKGRRTALLRRANVFFALCVVWNLAAILGS
jgi:hypothetical protein